MSDQMSARPVYLHVPGEEPAEEEAREDIEVTAFDRDAYGLFALRLTEWWDPRDITPTPKAAVMAAFTLWFINMLFQGGITVGMLQNCEALESPFEAARLQEDMNMSSDEAIDLLFKGFRAPDKETALAIVPEAVLEKCTHAVGARLEFYFALIFLWFVKNWSEMEKSATLFKRFLRTRTRLGKTDKILSEDAHTIVRLDDWQKYVLCMAIPVVKVCVVFPVTYAGCKFLILQTSETKVILKALCMQFIVSIDELLFALATARTKQAVSKFKLESAKFPLPEGLRHRKSVMWDTSSGLAFSLMVSASYVCVVMFWTFGALMRFRIACNCYSHKHGLPDGVETPFGILDVLLA